MSARLRLLLMLAVVPRLAWASRPAGPVDEVARVTHEEPARSGAETFLALAAHADAAGDLLAAREYLRRGAAIDGANRIVQEELLRVQALCHARARRDVQEARVYFGAGNEVEARRALHDALAFADAAGDADHHAAAMLLAEIQRGDAAAPPPAAPDPGTHPGDSPVLANLRENALASERAQDWVEARRLYREALVLSPLDEDLLHGLDRAKAGCLRSAGDLVAEARVYLDAEDFDEAARALENAVAFLDRNSHGEKERLDQIDDLLARIRRLSDQPPTPRSGVDR